MCSLKSHHVTFNGYIWSFEIEKSTVSNSTILCCSKHEISAPPDHTSSASLLKPLIIARPSLGILRVAVQKSYRTKLRALYVLLGAKEDVFLTVVTLIDEILSVFLTIHNVCFFSSTKDKVTALNLQLNCVPSTTSQDIPPDVFASLKPCESMNRSQDGVINVAYILEGPNIVTFSTDRINLIILNTADNCYHQYFVELSSSLSSWSPVWVTFNQSIFTTTLLLQDKLKRPSMITFSIDFHPPTPQLLCIDSSSVIPLLYADIMLCVDIQMMTESEPKTFHTTLVTKNSQLLCFLNGKITNSTWLPFNHTKEIVMMESPAGRFICLLSSEHKFCAIDQTSFKVCFTTDGISNIFVDDFVRNGSTQLLLLKSTQFNEFILTDFHCIHSDTSNNPDNSSATAPMATLASAVIALNQRLQTGLARVRENEGIVKSRSVFIRRMCSDLQNMHLPSEMQVHNNEEFNRLVPLIGMAVKDPVAVDNPTSTGLKASLEWTHCISSVFIVGIKVFNGTNCDISNPRLQVLPSLATSLSSLSKCFTCVTVSRQNSSEAEKPSSFKKRKFDSSLSCEHFQFHDLCRISSGCSAIVAAQVNVREVMNNRLNPVLIYETGVDRKVSSLHCGEINCDFSDVVRELDAAQVSESHDMTVLCAFYATQKVFHFTACSSLTETTETIQRVLLGSLGFIRHESLDCYMALKPTLLSELCVEILEDSQGITLRCLYRTKDQLELFVHLLLDNLPHEITINVRASHNASVSNPCKALHREASMICREFRQLVTNATKGQSSTSGEGDARVRFEERRRKVQSFAESTCSAEDFNSAMKRVMTEKMKTEEELIAHMKM
ncbi:hypothetical protein CAPTEDRAFT_218401 [Capitella teleta]|uniref:Fanconi anemia group B protein n=1 Tax=Capitella teleta TaxID=283909 RepID=R7TDP5_CAPTE|nr:hypothetical protein CAPTEDRAFT_218401 [Capitella teleta]|eukprot:ELT91819.1 hypothetical protein CAPTEDRAFT_218401 [Capitella teleta]